MDLNNNNLFLAEIPNRIFLSLDSLQTPILSVWI